MLLLEHFLLSFSDFIFLYYYKSYHYYDYCFITVAIIIFIIVPVIISSFLRSSLFDSSFNVRDPENRNVGCGHYPLSIIFKKNNTCSWALLNINCDAGGCKLWLWCLDTDEIYYWCSCHWTLLTDINFKVTSENKLYTLLKKLIEKLTFWGERIFKRKLS